MIEFLDDERVELYDLSQDVGETENLAEKLAEKRKELLEELQQWRLQVKASMPRPNPAYQKHPNLPHSSGHKN